MPELNPIIGGAAVLLGAVLGYALRSLFVPFQIKAAVNAAWRQIEDLQRTRAIKDNRDNLRLF